MGPTGFVHFFRKCIANLFYKETMNQTENAVKYYIKNIKLLTLMSMLNLKIVYSFSMSYFLF